MAHTIVQTSSFFAFLWLFLAFVYPALVRFLSVKNMNGVNYLGKQIPISVGVLIPMTNLAALPWAMGIWYDQTYILQTVCLFLISYVGWKDDRFGGHEAKGIKGHVLYAVKERKISTGLWKALIGCGIAFSFSVAFSTSIWELVIHFLLISLLTNLINLFDLRPGRALKGYFFLFTLLLGFTYRVMPFPMWLPTMVTAVFLFQKDLKGMIMLGDAGSNVLGMVLGFWTVLYAPIPFKIFMVGFALAVHLYAEKKSLSQLIQKKSLLHWLDMLGR